MNKQKFVYVSYIKTTPETLWTALTSREFTEKYWFQTSVVSELKTGAPITFHNPDGDIVIEGKILVVEKPWLLSYTWTSHGDEKARAEAPSRVTFRLEPSGEMVKLTVTHDDFVDNSVVFPRINQGWPMVLSSLKSLLENGQALATGPATCK